MAVLGLFKAIMGICQTKPVSPETWSIEGGKVRVKLSQIPEMSQKGGAVYLKGQGLDKPVLIVRTEEDKYLAFENRCSHGGRKLDPVAGEPVLRCCSIGHTTFDHDGNKIKGPGNKPLKKYMVEINNGDLLIAL